MTASACLAYLHRFRPPAAPDRVWCTMLWLTSLHLLFVLALLGMVG